MKMIHQLLGLALTMSAGVEINQNEWKDRILKEWEMSKNYPRKKKKRVRKHLQLDWGFACWNPFDELMSQKF